MLSKIKEMIRVLPVHMAEVIKFDVLVGFRPNEAIESVKLLNSPNLGAKIGPNSPKTGQYYDEKHQVLEHFRFPNLFLRAHKKGLYFLFERG